MHCPNKHGLMLLTVKAEVDDLIVETYCCTKKDCDKQINMYTGDRNLTFNIRKHFGIATPKGKK